MVSGVIEERRGTRDSSVQEVTSKWGDRQTIAGPRIQVPYRKDVVETQGDTKEKVRKETHFAQFLPETLKIKGKLDCERRYRGIFEVPVYSMTSEFSGTFAKPDFSGWDVSPEDVLWDRACLVVSISDVRGISDRAVLSWNHNPIDFEPGLGEGASAGGGIHVCLGPKSETGELAFSFNLSLKGSEGILIAALGSATFVELESNWTAPSFKGNWLPSERTFGPEGFKARWVTSYLGRNFPQRWIDGGGWDQAVSASTVGVDLITPVDEYRMAQRSVKYAALFLCLTFATLWLFEVLAGLRIHPVQYLLMGAAMSLFYLLELSLSEHIGFSASYVLATLAVIVVVASYCHSVLGSVPRSSIVASVMATLYGYLYVVLQNQDYALLVGSLGLCVALALVMYLTRKVDWYARKEVRLN
jgi:inner membrane protein